jgi:hypothetical protein
MKTLQLKKAIAFAVSFVFIGFLVSGSQPANADLEGPSTKEIMQANFAALSTAFGASIDADDFESPKNRKKVRAALETLAKNAGELKAHGKDLNRESKFLKASFQNDAEDALRAYEAGYYPESRFVLHQMIDNCIGCHTKLRSDSGFEIKGEFLAGVNTDKLTLGDRVRVELATRQFVAAMQTYEDMFRMPELTPQQIDLDGAFQGYLEVAVQVRSEYARAARVLRLFQERKDVPGYLDSRIDAWTGALDQLAKKSSGNEGVTEAKRLLQTAREQSVFPEDPNALVYYIAAAGVLHRYIDTEPENEEALAEAFYLLGVAESHVNHSYWISETEYFLEVAIRMAPKAPFARSAFNFLEDLTTAGYSGSAGVNIPGDVKERIEELRVLVEGEGESM